MLYSPFVCINTEIYEKILQKKEGHFGFLRQLAFRKVMKIMTDVKECNNLNDSMNDE